MGGSVQVGRADTQIEIDIQKQKIASHDIKYPICCDQHCSVFPTLARVVDAPLCSKRDDHKLNFYSLAIKFVVHKEFACQSPVFKVAFNSVFIEGQTQTYTLGNTTEAVVRLLVNWFYTLKLDISEQARGQPYKREENLALCQFWNLIIRSIREIRETVGTVLTTVLIYVWEITAKDSPLRLLLLHQCSIYLIGEWFTKEPEQFPKEMLIEFAKLNAKFRNGTKMLTDCGYKNNTAQYEVQEGKSTR
ncbi:hypothetical protein LSUE1_G005519 [Lachnellula suecica]|uniref:BTB domain-containing protein n=1 Tax=Lachnellula suecica TaxID=602035 RepID=A0A8T9C1H8_9HELO|nr:hypothetical protein LSUE1_G005519 [Lachnellula suecica]